MAVCLSLVQRFAYALRNLTAKSTDPTSLSAAIRAAKRLVAQAQVTSVPLYPAIIPFILGLLHYRHKTRWPEAFALTTEVLKALETAAFAEFLDSKINPSLNHLSLNGGACVGGLSDFVAAYLSLYSPSFSPLVSALWELLLAAEGVEISEAQEVLGSTVSRKNPVFLKAKQHEIRVYKPHLENAFGTAVRVFGCEQLLGLGSAGAGARLSLSLAADESVSFEAFVRDSNVWMLPLLQRFVCRDKVGFFAKEILPAAAAVQKRAEEAAAAGRLVESGDWFRVYRQLWGLLPAFFSQPLDLAETLATETDKNGKCRQLNIIPRLLELVHDVFLREAACAAIVAIAKSAAPPGVETPQLQQQLQQQQMEGLETKGTAKGSATAAGVKMLCFLRRLADAAAAAAGDTAAAADVRVQAAAAARAAHLCCPTDSSLLAAGVTAAATAEANKRALAAYAEETLGFLTVRYLLLHKETAAAAAAQPAEEAFASLSASAKAKAAQQILQAIQAFAPLCPRRLMELNVKRFSSAILSSVSSSVSSSAPRLAPKETAALLDVCDALRPFTAVDVGAELFQALLTLLRRCTSALSSSSSSGSNSSNKAVLRTLQRKAYGALKHALDDPGHHKGFVVGHLQLLEVWAAFKEGRGTAAAAIDLKQRLGCLLAFLQCLDRHRKDLSEEKWSELLQEVLPSAVPEVLLSLKDPNKRSREIAAASLETLGTLCGDKQLHLTSLATFVAAGFGGITAETGGPQGASGAPPFLKAAAALALGRLLDLYSDELPHSQIQRWAEVGLLLLNDHNRTAFVAGIHFAKACIRAGDMDDLAAWLPSMLSVLDNPNAPKARMKIRHLIEKLCKLMGEEAVEKAMPEQHIPLLRYLLRSERRRTVRRLIQKSLKGATESGDESEASADGAGGLVDSETESESDEEGEEELSRSRKAKAAVPDPDPQDLGSGVKAVGLKSLLDAFEEESDGERHSRRKRQTRLSPSAGLCVFEGGEDADASSAVLDFCGISAAQQILVGMQPRKDRKTQKAGRGEKRESKFSKVKINEKGKIVIEEEDEEEKPSTTFSIGKKTPTTGSRLKGTKGSSTSAAVSPAAGAKGSSSSSSSKNNLSCLAARRAALREMRKKQSGGHFLQRSGEEFKAKRAKGDLKTKQGMEPYAFLKLNRGVLKEKYRAQAVRSLKSVFNKHKKRGRSKAKHGPTKHP